MLLSAAAHYRRHVIAIRRHWSLPEYLLECLTELATHAAVERKVHGIRQNEEKVGEQDAQVGYSIVEEIDKQRADHVQSCDDGQRYLDNEKDADDNYQHERRAVLVISSFRLLVALVEEFLPLLLSHTHRMKQQDVEENEHYARQEMYEDNAKHEVERVVIVLADVVVHPFGEPGMAHHIPLAIPYSLCGLVNSGEQWWMEERKYFL